MTYLDDRINSVINSYFHKYKGNLGYLLIYPLLRLEEHCIELGEKSTTCIEEERYAISWFIREISSLGIHDATYSFNEEEYANFKKMYFQIKAVWDDYQYKLKLNDMNSYGQFKVEIIKNNVQITRPAIMNSMFDASIYGRGTHDREGMQKDSEAAFKVIRYLTTRNLIQLKRIEKGRDQDFIELCISRVDRDFTKLGGNIVSASILKLANFRKFVGFLYSISQFKIFCKISKIPGIFSKGDELVISYNKQELIELIYRSIRIPIEELRTFMDYFSFSNEHEGSFQEFPLVLHKENIYFIPSSLILNDWHFNIPNGHYYKNIEITNRNNTIAHTIVSWVAERAKRYNNVIVVMEKDYQKIAHQQGKKGSEIDLALYDIKKNVLVIIECKWQENVYNPTENHLNTQRIFNYVFKKQLPVHEQFLQDKLNIDFIFDYDERVKELTHNVQIKYMMLDKRVQLHLENKHLITVYMMLQLMDIYSSEGTLQLDELFKKIESFETEIDYELIGSCSDFEFEEYKVKAENLTYSYLLP